MGGNGKVGLANHSSVPWLKSKPSSLSSDLLFCNPCEKLDEASGLALHSCQLVGGCVKEPPRELLESGRYCLFPAFLAWNSLSFAQLSHFYLLPLGERWNRYGL